MVAQATPPRIFKRGDSPKYWVRFSIKGQGQIRIPLGTTDEGEAERLAQQEHQRAVLRAEEGLLAVKSSFEKVAREFIGEIKSEVASGSKKAYTAREYPAVIERYFIPYFGKKPVDMITSGDIARYQTWRRTYWISGPGAEVAYIEYERHGRMLRRPAQHEAPSTGRMRAEASLMRALFNFAAKHDYIPSGKIPAIDTPKAEPSPRPSFDYDEMRKLLKVSHDRVIDLDNRKDMLADRAKLDCYVNIAVFTGMRPTELKNLNWGDVLWFRENRDKPIGEQDVRIRAVGKKAKHRDIVPMENVLPFFATLWNLFEQEVGRSPDDADPVFAHADGARIGSFSKGLTELLRVAELLYDRSGHRRSAYSFRHFYIGQQILSGVDAFTIAVNTRTSVQMIEQYYASNLIPEQMVQRLRPEWKRT